MKYVIHMKATELYVNVSVVLFFILCNLKVRSYILNPYVKSWSVTIQMKSEILATEQYFLLCCL